MYTEFLFMLVKIPRIHILPAMAKTRCCRLSTNIQEIELGVQIKNTKPTSEVLGGFLSQCNVHACRACLRELPGMLQYLSFRV